MAEQSSQSPQFADTSVKTKIKLNQNHNQIKMEMKMETKERKNNNKGMVGGSEGYKEDIKRERRKIN